MFLYGFRPSPNPIFHRDREYAVSGIMQHNKRDAPIFFQTDSQFIRIAAHPRARAPAAGL